jgi:hypothetical protein
VFVQIVKFLLSRAIFRGKNPSKLDTRSRCWLRVSDRAARPSARAPDAFESGMSTNLIAFLSAVGETNEVRDNSNAKL